MLDVNGKILCANCFTEQPQLAVSASSFCGVCGFDNASAPENTGTLPISTVLLGKYVIGKVLGRGGFGITYLAYDITRERRVAIKEYFPDSLSFRVPGTVNISSYSGEKHDSYLSGSEKFYNEAKILSRFNGNPNIINVQEFFYENNTAYYVMEYVEGIDLKRYIANNGGKLSYQQVMSLLLPMVDALIIIHSLDVLHRDISPDNIYVTSDGYIKLLDFGAARQVMLEQSGSMSVIMKQGFTPLEQYKRRGNHGPWSDIYSLGVTVYYALTGIVPDDAINRADNDSLKTPSQLKVPVPAQFEKVLMKMIAVKPENRYKSAIELKDALNGQRGGKSSDSPNWFTKSWKKISIITACVVFLVLGACVLTYLLSGGSDDDSDYVSSGRFGSDDSNESKKEDDPSPDDSDDIAVDIPKIDIPSAELTLGNYNNGVYTNDYFGVSLEVDNSWYIVENDYKFGMLNSTMDVMADSGIDHDLIKLGEENLLPLFYALEHDPSYTGTFNANISMLAEKLTGIATTTIKNEEDYYNQAKLSFDSIDNMSGYPCSYQTSELFTETLTSGTNVSYYTINCYIEGIPSLEVIYQVQMLKKIGDYVIILTGSCMDEESSEYLSNMLSTFSVKDNRSSSDASNQQPPVVSNQQDINTPPAASGTIMVGGKTVDVNATGLDLSDCGLTDISELSKLTNLTKLYLSNNEISDISPLMNLTKLQELKIDNNYVDDLSPLAELTNLYYLGARDNDIFDLSALSKLTELQHVDLGNNFFNDVNPLSKLNNLIYLDLENNYIVDINPLANLTGLTNLYINSNYIEDIRALSNMTMLVYLDISKNNQMDINPLAALTKLVYLNACGLNISDIKVMSNLKNLSYVVLSDNMIEDDGIDVLSKLTNISELYLDSNYISNITALSSLNNLSYLDISYNSVSQDQINVLSASTGCEISS